MKNLIILIFSVIKLSNASLQKTENFERKIPVLSKIEANQILGNLINPENENSWLNNKIVQARRKRRSPKNANFFEEWSAPSFETECVEDFCSMQEYRETQFPKMENQLDFDLEEVDQRYMDYFNINFRACESEEKDIKCSGVGTRACHQYPGYRFCECFNFMYEDDQNDNVFPKPAFTSSKESYISPFFKRFQEFDQGRCDIYLDICQLYKDNNNERCVDPIKNLNQKCENLPRPKRVEDFDESFTGYKCVCKDSNFYRPLVDSNRCVEIDACESLDFDENEMICTNLDTEPGYVLTEKEREKDRDFAAKDLRKISASSKSYVAGKSNFKNFKISGGKMPNTCN